MPRSRVIKPEFWDDEKLAAISRDARLTFIGLWTYSDDYGVVKGHPGWLKNKIYPYEEIRSSDFQKWLTELEKLQCILPFESDGEKFYYIRTFTTHQTINRPSAQRYPEPPSNLFEDSRSTHGALIDETETETETETEVKQKPKQKRVTMMDRFEDFWKSYPKKKSRGDAEKAWVKINPSEPLIEHILSAVQRATTSIDWTKDNGQYIPHPASWLNRKGWEDEYTTGGFNGNGTNGRGSAGQSGAQAQGSGDKSEYPCDLEEVIGEY
jgi:hypothetical protein